MKFFQRIGIAEAIFRDHLFIVCLTLQKKDMYKTEIKTRIGVFCCKNLDEAVGVAFRKFSEPEWDIGPWRAAAFIPLLLHGDDYLRAQQQKEQA
jgi:hypothetical protein